MASMLKLSCPQCYLQPAVTDSVTIAKPQFEEKYEKHIPTIIKPLNFGPAWISKDQCRVLDYVSSY